MNDHSVFLVGVPPQFFLFGFTLTWFSMSPGFAFTVFWAIYSIEVFAIFVDQAVPATRDELATLLYHILFLKPIGFYIGIATALVVGYTFLLPARIQHLGYIWRTYVIDENGERSGTDITGARAVSGDFRPWLYILATLLTVVGIFAVIGFFDPLLTGTAVVVLGVIAVVIGLAFLIGALVSQARSALRAPHADARYQLYLPFVLVAAGAYDAFVTVFPPWQFFTFLAYMLLVIGIITCIEVAKMAVDNRRDAGAVRERSIMHQYDPRYLRSERYVGRIATTWWLTLFTPVVLVYLVAWIITLFSTSPELVLTSVFFTALVIVVISFALGHHSVKGAAAATYGRITSSGAHAKVEYEQQQQQQQQQQYVTPRTRSGHSYGMSSLGVVLNSQ